MKVFAFVTIAGLDAQTEGEVPDEDAELLIHRGYVKSLEPVAKPKEHKAKAHTADAAS